MTQPMEVGAMGWLDLAVDDAESMRAFYEAVVGWRAQAVSMGQYADYAMHPQGSDSPVAGVCHRRGVNAGQPGGWIPYFVVADLDASVRECKKRGGRELADRRGDGFVVVADPSGAVCALYQKP